MFAPPYYAPYTALIPTSSSEVFTPDDSRHKDESERLVRVQWRPRYKITFLAAMNRGRHKAGFRPTWVY